MLTREQMGSILSEARSDPHVQVILLTGTYVYGTPTVRCAACRFPDEC